jgi:hypothetical protein
MDWGGSLISRRCEFLQWGHNISVGFIDKQPRQTLVLPWDSMTLSNDSINHHERWNKGVNFCLSRLVALGRISKTVMNDIPSVPIGDFENEIPLSFPSEETSLGSGLYSHLPLGDVPCPSSRSHGFLHHTIGTLNNAK